MEQIHFLDDGGTFALKNPEEVSGLYFPLASETGLKSAITPSLGGDCKLDQETFLLEPVSIEDLHAPPGISGAGWTAREPGRLPECRRNRSRSNSPRPRRTAR